LSDWGGAAHTILYGVQDQSLPVQLVSFTAGVVSGGVALKWVTESEVENAGFEVWRSAEENENYDMISSYQYNPALVGQGYSNHQHEYKYLDEKVIAGQVCWYKLVDVSMSGERNEHGPWRVAVLLNDGFLTSVSTEIPDNYQLYQNYPNPFNPNTHIRFDIPQRDNGSTETSLLIYNSLGQMVRILYRGRITAGSFEIEWDGKGDGGNLIPSGIYYISFVSGDYREVRRIVLLK
jgi:hypothetical protein